LNYWLFLSCFVDRWCARSSLELALTDSVYEQLIVRASGGYPVNVFIRCSCPADGIYGPKVSVFDLSQLFVSCFSDTPNDPSFVFRAAGKEVSGWVKVEAPNG